MTEGSNDEMLEDLRKSLQLAVCKIVFGEDRKQGTRTTQSAIAALTELTYQYATKSLVPDLYTFSTHANRKSTISPEDVALVLRKIQPDQLEAFKNNFCRGGGKGSTSSKNATGQLYNENDGKRSTTTAGRRRKRSETDVLSLSSSSSSSSDESESMADGKRKRIIGRSSVSPRRTNTKSIGRKGTDRESLLNKFQLRSGPSASIAKKSALDYDTLSSDDDDSIVISPPKGLGNVKTGLVAEKGTTAKKSGISPKLSLKRSPRKKEQSKSRRKNDHFLYDDDDSTNDDDSFLGRNAKRTVEKVVDLQRQVANSSDRENESKQNFDDDEIGTGGNRLDSKKIGGIKHGSQKPSQVAEALANLSSDSGMEVDDSEDDNAMHAGKPAFSHRHRPRIESDDDE